MFSFKDRCYKWEYFTRVDTPISQQEVKVTQDFSSSDVVPIMWCSRFLKWKHPELPILMAERLKRKGYHFSLDMYGSGILYDRAITLAKKYAVDNIVRFCGNIPNDEILAAMRNHDIFLFTSDQNEGWGAVANEAMSNGCVLVGSDAIGSTQYLVNDKVNGLLFKSANKRSGFTKLGIKVDSKALDSLTEKVEWLLNHPLERKQIAIAAYNNMKNVWSPKNAANNLISLIENLQKGRDTLIEVGPCSKAFPL